MENSSKRKKFQIKATCYDKKGKVISTAFNNYYKTHPLQTHFANLVGLPVKDKLHAEILALVRAKEKKVHRIKIERYDFEGNPVLAAPCPVCACAIKAFGVKYVDHT